MFPLRLRQILTVLPVGSGTVEFTAETTFTPSAAIVPESTLKPQMAISFTEASSKCSTIASYVKASKQSLADTAMLQSWLNVRLGYSVNLKEEATIIGGDSTNGISGLLQLGTPFAYTPAATDTSMDVIARAVGHLMWLGYVPDGLILNASDYTGMRLLKTTIGSYIFLGNPAEVPTTKTSGKIQD